MSGATIIISPASGIPVSGLTFASNGVAGSAAAMAWSGSAMLPRFTNTRLWKAKFVDQVGYYGWSWYCKTDNSWDFGLTGWELGCHPHPTDGRHDANGYSTGGTGSSGTVHYHEIANGSDKISDGGSGLVVVKGVELWQAAVCEQVGSDYVARFYPDVQNNPGFVITWTNPVASTAADPGIKYRQGGSPWTESGTTNDESPSGTFWHFLQYAAAKNITQIAAKFALTNNDTTDPDRHYSNISPTPTDISDKSGKGNHPAWENASRPTAWP